MVNDANTPAVLRSRQDVLAIAIRIAVLTALIAFPLLEVGNISAQCPPYGNSTLSFGEPLGITSGDVALGDFEENGDLDPRNVSPYRLGHTSLNALIAENLGLYSGYLLERENSIQNSLPEPKVGPQEYLDDLDGDGTPDAFKFRYLFTNGYPPPAPYPLCGPDPTPDNLDCAAFPPCL